MKEFLLFFVVIILFLGCVETTNSFDEFKTYTLDVSDIVSTESGTPVQGTLHISHNAIALFPLNLNQENQKFAELSPNTIMEIRTNEGCWSNQPDSPFTEQQISNLFNRAVENKIQKNNSGDIRKISLEMPYRTTQDDFVRTPSTFCIGFHIKNNGWTWNLNPISPTLDSTNEKGFAEVKVDKQNVDAIAILFDNGTAINKISFEAIKTS